MAFLPCIQGRLEPRSPEEILDHLAIGGAGQFEDGHSHQRHHPWLEGLVLQRQTLEEGPPSVPIDRRGKAEQDVEAAGRTDGFAQLRQRLQQRRQREDRQGQDQRNSEPLAEIRRHVGMVILMALVLILGGVFMFAHRSAPLG